MDDTVTAAKRYDALAPDREPFLKRARDCSQLTIPFLVPPEGSGSSTTYTTPYQSFGARGVRTLSSKLLISLFPTNTPFYRYAMDDLTVENLGTQRGEVEKALSARERATMTEIEAAAFRPVAYTTFQHLVVAGNFLLNVPVDGGPARGFRLDQYVVKRDPWGNLLEIVVKETLSPGSLPEDVRSQVIAKMDGEVPKEGADTRTVDLYTHIYLDAKIGKYVVYQEAAGIRLSGDGTYTPDDLEWLPLRLASQPGEDYGRSYVEEYLGDLDSLEGLTQTLVEGSAASARVVFLVSPNGVTNLKVVANASNGDVVSGEANDVSTLQVNKQADLAVAKEFAQEISQRLSYAFLMSSAIQRNGERVTAEEIRVMASDLDDALGGVYTLQSATFQLPVVRLFEKRMEKRTKAPPLPEDLVKPVIVTGMAAIGRGNDQTNLRTFLTDMAQVFGPEVLGNMINPAEAMSRAAASYGVDPNNLVKTQDQLASTDQQAQLMALVQQLGPNAVNQLGNMGTKAMDMAAPAQGPNG